ncbi:hypothetical protein MtrunA17_Chr4g0021601 [Medicago truncatula]|uniref:Uncharacterized protein n=1 Tax=Medicago truncatula TaxID=3880 RepID=A0A396I380_MEDTR|nr:hypothetical protein MtrunA17_Chr4g0021601 [Medicago truncatula]
MVVIRFEKLMLLFPGFFSCGCWNRKLVVDNFDFRFWLIEIGFFD